MYNCNSCEYAVFNYNRKWKLKNVYCKRVKQYLSVSRYRKLKMCLFYKNKGG